MKKPEPINKHIVCSVCGMEWEKHGEKPTLEKCVELLKAELAKKRVYPLPFSGSTATYSESLRPTQMGGIPLSHGDDIGKAN